MSTKTKPRTKKRRTKKKPKPRLLRTSERSTWAACRQQWYWSWVENLKRRDEAPALRFGSLIHKALELRYPPGIRRGPHPAQTFEKLYLKDLQDAEDTWGFTADEQWESALDIGVDMMEMYVEHYGKDSEWKVIASEMTFQVPVYAPEWLFDLVDAGQHSWIARENIDLESKPLFYYVGTMDGVWENRMDGGIRVNDYKTTSGDPVKEGMSKWADEQTTAYWTWGVDWLEQERVLSRQKRQRLDGMLFTFLHKVRRDPRPQDKDGHYLNQDGSVSKNQPTPMFHRELVYRSEADREHARTRAIQQFLEMEAARRGELAIYKTPGTGFPRFVCNTCAFRDMCELHEVGADWKAIKNTTLRTEDPYAAHLIEEEGKY